MTRDGLFFVGCLLLASWVVAWLQPYDSTDDNESGTRSGLVLYTDHETGCQYVSAGHLGSGLAARLDGSGNQMGCRQ